MCTACSCSTTDATATQAKNGEGTVYTVTGMTCGHCVSSVSAEIGKVPGVSGVAVDLSTGAVTVDGAGFSDEQIREAVERAGYSLAGATPVAAS
ncbi:heavy-metal-associated domain-containing protein [Planomonospora sp. ID91781]|uniref:heavy-metal-associated domain-containing protein n=1 Tax=Planomonospora sp. ID91781 TaxID=2738135 RepID=UPI0018C44E34|nr:heavy-metal-associated domain-containing protein [Planomonospora sp. ID91781]MBG0823307.1 heavy-metal-associated domain-containing protein [Planomonospora sp. ID91781]